MAVGRNPATGGSGVCFVTCAEFPGLSKDDMPLLAELRRRGIGARAAIWDDGKVDWGSFDICVIRSTWGYYRKLGRFISWAGKVDALTSLWNPARVVEWNSHKGYLRDLEAHGVPIVPTIWLERGSVADLRDIMRENGWDRIVVKPSVSAGSFETRSAVLRSVATCQRSSSRLLRRMDLMVQPFMASVETYGERSLIMIGGRFSHAINKGMALSHRRNQLDSVSAARAKNDELSLARRALAAVGSKVMYARVDIMRDGAGRPVLSELELIEPSLYLRFAPSSIKMFADVITGMM